MDNQPSIPLTPQPGDPAQPKKPSLLPMVILTSLLIITTSLSIIFFLQANSAARNAQSVENLPEDNASITLPIRPDDPDVAAARILYNFDTVIKEVRKEPEVEIITDVNAPLPRLIITPQTEIYLVNSSSAKRTNTSALQPRQKIKLTIYYGLKTQEWTISRINILVADSPTPATPSASVKL